MNSANPKNRSRKKETSIKSDIIQKKIKPTSGVRSIRILLVLVAPLYIIFTIDSLNAFIWTRPFLKYKALYETGVFLSLEIFLRLVCSKNSEVWHENNRHSSLFNKEGENWIPACAGMTKGILTYHFAVSCWTIASSWLVASSSDPVFNIYASARAMGMAVP